MQEIKGIDIKKIIENSGDGYCEYHYELLNESKESIFLEKFELFSSENLVELGLKKGEYAIYRSGRHKNDMPGVFITGKKDERLFDVCTGMTESGDLIEGVDGGCLKVVSDHLTLVRDCVGKTFAIEFLTGRDQLFETVITLDSSANVIKISSSVIFNIYIDSNQTLRTETIRTALVCDVQKEVDTFAQRKALMYGARNEVAPSVFCTWYFYELNVTYEDVKTNLRLIKERHLPYEVFQLDEGWEVTLGEYRPNEKFPVSMETIASEIRKARMIPGLWSSPFVAHETASIWKSHPEWILKDSKGNPCLFPMNETVYYVFDITNSKTWEYFRELYHKFTFEWGFVYHKLDFTRAAVIFEDANFYNKKITLARAYYEACKAIREGMGEDSFFLMCGGLYDPIIGLVDAQRTGSDVLSMWSSNINKNGKTAPYTIRQSIMRSYMNNWWANDPDALMVRRNEVMERNSRLTLGLLNDDEVKTLVMNQFMSGGLMCQTEPLDKIEDDRLFEIRHILPVVDSRVCPVDIMSTSRFPENVLVSLVDTGALCLCITNWSDDTDKEIVVDLKAFALEQGKYAVCGFYSGEYVLDANEGDVVRLGALKPHASEVIKIEKIDDKPIIIASDNHYSFGAECLTLDIEDDNLVIEVRNIVPVDINYKVLLPEGRSVDQKRIVDVMIEKEEENIARLAVEVELDA